MNFAFDVYYGIFMVDESENELLFDATEYYTCYHFLDVKIYIVDHCGYESLMYIMEDINITINERYIYGETRDGFPINGFCNKH